MTPSKTLPHDVIDFLQSEEAIVAYLDAVMEVDDLGTVEERVAFIADAYSSVQRARAIAPLLHIPREITDDDREWLDAKPVGKEN